ncbi:MAG TPA: hypothetical protein VN843_12850 [Anaerolineales bacterium]|nr:hypothetical protein [Anaerolineales bacterium]
MSHTQKEENPFLGRILEEEPIAANDLFRVVRDRDPIVPYHFLLYPIKQVDSLADFDRAAISKFLQEEFSPVFPDRDFLLVERGRSTFCSSFDGIIHAHAHLVPKDSCNITLPARAVEVSTLDDALKMLENSSEYLLAGTINSGFRVLTPLENVPKRVARLLLAGEINLM